MRTLTNSELKQWCQSQAIELDDRDTPVIPDRKPLPPSTEVHMLKCGLPETLGQLTWFCAIIEGFLQPREHCLLWITRWGVWPSSENWHLYYRLRQSYSDHKLIYEAPGHLFMQYEIADLISLLEVGLIAGWDMHLIPTIGYGRVFVSHDEWVLFVADDDYPIAQLTEQLTKGKIKIIDNLPVA